MSRFNCDNVKLYTRFTTAFLHLQLCVCVCACVCACLCTEEEGHLLEYDITAIAEKHNSCDAAFSLMGRPHTDLVQ